LIIHAGRVRDYLKRHEAYDDPASDLSSRLRQVQASMRRLTYADRARFCCGREPRMAWTGTARSDLG
jgi:hypothetical protein